MFISCLLGKFLCLTARKSHDFWTLCRGKVKQAKPNKGALFGTARLGNTLHPAPGYINKHSVFPLYVHTEKAVFEIDEGILK